MGHLLNPLEGTLLFKELTLYCSPTSNSPKFCSYIRKKNVKFKKKGLLLLSSLQGGFQVAYDSKVSPVHKANSCNEGESDALPYVQTLREFPKEKLAAKLVMIRFDSSILLKEEMDQKSRPVYNAVSTIKYVHQSGAKIILVSNWKKKTSSKLLDAESAADILSSILQHKVVALQCISSYLPLKMENLRKADIFLLENISEFKEEVANCSSFAELLSTGVDIFVNDSFSLSHKLLASTVAITRFCSACVAGFHFEESLYQLKKAAKSDKRPYIAIIGGANLDDKAAALHFLASKCDGLVFVGTLSLQIMHALGYSVPSSLIEPQARKAALDIIQFAQDRNIPILCPRDLWFVSDFLPKQMEIFPAHDILNGWSPVDLGPRSLDEINSFLLKCKKILWIGSVNFKFPSPRTNGASILARTLTELSQQNCDVIAVGSMACKAMMMESSSDEVCDIIESASVVWEFFKGRKLPGLVALDRVCAWNFISIWFLLLQHEVIENTERNKDYGHRCVCRHILSRLIGNGLFLLRMARRRKDLNFLGLEINKKLVKCCQGSVSQSGLQNGYFIATNATTTFRSIVSSYPGELILVSIQCPNPDFNNPENRWRMLQQSLVEAVIDLLAHNGKIFLQSDVEAVAVRMKELFLKYGNGRLSIANDQYNKENDNATWLKENPFGVRSDWEQHVLDRGAPMYRLMLSKSTNIN